MNNIEYLEKAESSSDFFNKLNALLNNSLKKEFAGTEFEIKLSLNTLNSDLYEINKNVSDIFENTGCFLFTEFKLIQTIKYFSFFQRLIILSILFFYTTIKS